MAVISSGNHPKGKWPGIYLHWGAAYKQHPRQSEDLFNYTTSKKAYEEMVELTGFGQAPVKPEGSAVFYDTESQQVVTTARHVTYAIGYIVTEEELDDNLYTEVSMNRATANAFSLFTTEQTIAANVYNNGFDATVQTFGDGKELLATNHPTLSGDQSNELSTAADLSEASLEDLLINVMNAKNSRGHQIPVTAKCLIVPVNLAFEAERIVNSALRVSTADNDLNAIKNMGMLPEGVKVNNYLTDTDAWFLRTDVPGGMTAFERKRSPLSRDNDFDTGNAKAKSSFRISFTCGDWRSVYGSPGA